MPGWDTEPAMYIPPAHRLPDEADIPALVARHPLAAWVCATADGMSVHHLPFILVRDADGRDTLLAHVSRANPVWRALGPAQPSVVIFRGPQAYISPGWYPGKTAHGRVVPTWNYLAAHAHGTARVVAGREGLVALLTRLTDAQEATQPAPWRVQDAPADHIDALLRAIVGIEITVQRWEARLKASQDEDLDDRRGTVAGLQAQAGDEAQRMAALVAEAIARDSAAGEAGLPTGPGAPTCGR
jgi:transcriptional regulator